MNIFFLDTEPEKIARYHCDKHIVKMVLETAQLLCGAHWSAGGEAPYKLSHRNHPCAIWTRQSRENYRYLCSIGKELCREYTHRYGKRHKSEDVIEWCAGNIPDIPAHLAITPLPSAMPEQYKGECVVESYRKYYNGDKAHFAKWTNREVPFWFYN